MSLSISAPIFGQQTTPSATPSASAPAELTAGAAPSPTDTVKLSQTAQVHLLKQQGQTASQIATNLSITVATVNGYLGIAVAAAKSAPTAPEATAPAPTHRVPAKG